MTEFQCGVRKGILYALETTAIPVSQGGPTPEQIKEVTGVIFEEWMKLQEAKS